MDLVPPVRDTIGVIGRATILVIDDDVEMTEMLAEYLRPEGFDVEARHDGNSGLKTALASDCLLVVLDVMLPRLNGFEVLRRLRGAGIGKRINGNWRQAIRGFPAAERQMVVS